MLRAGDTVGGRYRVITRIAAGGMGTLWRAHHVELDVDVALKVLSMDRATPDLLKRFKREAQASARLRSPNIVHILDYGIHDEEPYLAMELLSGEDVAARIAREARLSVDDTARIMQAVARAMQYAHDAQIIHRDLKPANIFLEKVGDEEVVKVCDFGVAKDLRSNPDPLVTTGAAVLGSPAYMSPEQVWGEKVDCRTDVWSMGVVTFEMLTGVSPFADTTLAKTFERIVREPLPQARDFNASLPPSVDVFFEKAFARAPADRFASAKDFGDALRCALAPTDSREHARGKLSLEPALMAPTHDGPVALSATERAAPLSSPLPPPAPAVEARVFSRRRSLALWALVSTVLVGGGLYLQRGPSSEFDRRREEPELRTSESTPRAESSTRDASVSPVAAAASESLPVAPVLDHHPPRTPPASRSADRSQPPPAVVGPRREPATAAPSHRVDPTFGIPIPP